MNLKTFFSFRKTFHLPYIFCVLLWRNGRNLFSVWSFIYLLIFLKETQIDLLLVGTFFWSCVISPNPHDTVGIKGQKQRRREMSVQENWVNFWLQELILLDFGNFRCVPICKVWEIEECDSFVLMHRDKKNMLKHLSRRTQFIILKVTVSLQRFLGAVFCKKIKKNRKKNKNYDNIKMLHKKKLLLSGSMMERGKYIYKYFLEK